MTAANEGPITCPCCGNSSITQWPSDEYEYECDNCACLWDESVRRAQTAEGVDEAKEMEERVKEALWRDWVDRTGWKRESAKLGCGAALEHGQHWRFCGETDMGQTLPALCKECGGEYARARGGK